MVFVGFLQTFGDFRYSGVKFSARNQPLRTRSWAVEHGFIILVVVRDFIRPKLPPSRILVLQRLMIIKPSLEGAVLLEVAGIYDQSSKMFAEDWMLGNKPDVGAAECVLEEESTRDQIRRSSSRKVFRGETDGFE